MAKSLKAGEVMNLDIDVKKIFKTYEIDDEKYLYNCISAIELVNQTNSLYNIVNEICDILYDNQDYSLVEEIRNKSYDKIFGTFCSNKYITNVIALIGLAKNEVLEMKDTVHNILFYGSNGMRVRQMVFLSFIVNEKILDVDGFRFQYIVGKADCANILIHITKTAHLENFSDILQLSNIGIKDKWGISDICYECESWILSEEIIDCLESTSRILGFRSFFDIRRGADCTTDILKFVFGIFENEQDIDYSKLEENTSLQRKIKEKLVGGKRFHSGIGKIKTL